MRRVQMRTIPGETLESPSLELAKFHVYDNFMSFKKDERGRWFGGVASAVAAAAANYASWHSELVNAGEDADIEILTTCATDWRLVIGWASNPGLETGITIHPYHCFPYLPGSAVRGVVHHLAEIDLLEGVTPLPHFEPAALMAPPTSTMLDALQRAMLVRAVFGSLHLRRPHNARGRADGESDRAETPLEILEVWQRELSAVEDLSSNWRQVLSIITTLCGDENSGGVACFFDAVPNPRSLLAESPLQVDVLAPHYSDYYRDLDRGRTVEPADNEGPIPLKFLAVRQGLEFEFRIRLRMPDSTDEAGKEQVLALGGRDEGAIREQLLEWLLRAVTERGIGAKTTAGYGYFVPPAGTSVVGLAGAEPEPDPEVFAEQVLPSGKQMRDLIQIIDETQRRTAALQAAVARRFVAIYPKVVASWRKRQDDPEVQKRLAWLEKVGAIDSGRGGGES